MTIERFNYGLPSESITKIYERKKNDFVKGLTVGFSKQLEEISRKEKANLTKDVLTDIQKKSLKML